MSSRREFLGTAMISAGALPFIETFCSDQFLALAQSSDEFDHSVVNFWTQEVRKPYEAFQNGVALKGGPAYHPGFAYYAGPGSFLASSEIPTDDLPATGQVSVSLRVERFRPSDSSRELFHDAQSGSLRLDVKQTAALPSLQEALAWTAVAGLLPKQKNPFQDLDNLKFDTGTAWGQLQEVPLSNGLGFWAWNFFLKKKESLLGKIIDLFRTVDKAAPLFFPLLGLPAIALTALGAVDKLMGYLQASGNSNWLFKSADTPVFATKDGQKAIGQGLPLKTGHYLVMPEDHMADFGADREKLDLIDGYLVPIGTDKFSLIPAASKQILSVDYLSVYVRVKSAQGQKAT